MTYFFAWTDGGTALGAIWQTLQEAFSGAIDLIKWIPGIIRSSSTMSMFIIPQFSAIAVIALAIYVVKIVVGGDNK